MAGIIWQALCGGATAAARSPGSAAFAPSGGGPRGRGLHSFTFRLNLSAFCVIGVDLGVVQGVPGRCHGVLSSIRGCLGCILCQKQLRLS